MTSEYTDAINFMKDMYIKTGGDMPDKDRRIAELEEQLAKQTRSAQYRRVQLLEKQLAESKKWSYDLEKTIKLVGKENSKLTVQLAEAKTTQIIPLSPKFWRKVRENVGINEQVVKETLHNAGLNAYKNYSSMGKSGELWERFRSYLAKAIAQNKDIITFGKSVDNDKTNMIG